MSAALPPATRVAFCQASGHPRPTPVRMMPVVRHVRPLTPRAACASDQKLKLIDANGDGVISREEWKKPAAMHMTPKPAQTMLVQPSQRFLMHTLQRDTRIPHEQIAEREASPPKRSPSPSKGRRQSLPVKPVHAVEPVPTQAMQSGLHTLQLDTRFPHEQIAKLEASPPNWSPSPSRGRRQSLPVKPVHAVEPVPTQAMQSGLHTLQLDTQFPHEQIAKFEASPPKRPPSPSKGSPGPQSNDMGSPRGVNPRRSLGRVTKTSNTRVGGLTSDLYEEALNNYLDRCQRVRDQREQDSSLRITSLRREQWGLGGFDGDSSCPWPGWTVIGPPPSPGGASRTSPSPKYRARKCLAEDSIRRYYKDDRKTFVDEYFNEQEEMCPILPETIDENIKEIMTRGEASEVGDGETNTFVEPSKFAEFVGGERGIEDLQVLPMQL